MIARVTRARSLSSELAGALERAAAEERAGQYPLTKYAHDPCAYAHERLGIETLLPHQEAMLVAIARGEAGKAQPRVACKSGQKAGKSLTAIIASLFFYECFAAGRVWLTAAIEAQTRNVLWAELEKTLRHARERGVEIDGKLSTSPAGGFVSLDGSRSIRGITGREIEALAGLSGRQLIIVDEASHLPESKSQALAGNMMGGGSIFLISNPTRANGPFFDAFNSMKEFWQTFSVNSEDVAAWQEKSGVKIPYVAMRSTIETYRAMYGADSVFYKIRVQGEFVLNEEGKIVRLAWIVEAQERWREHFANREIRLTKADGRLHIGIDPAGESGQGDFTGFALRRGKIMLPLVMRKGLTAEGHLQALLELIRENVDAREEPPIVKVDSLGEIGTRVCATLSQYLQNLPSYERQPFVLVAVRSSDRALREPLIFERRRDELWENMAHWVREGGMLPADDGKLAAELNAPEWIGLVTGRQRATDKQELRKVDKLGRSPDRADSACLACYEIPSLEASMPVPAPRAPDDRSRLPDPYQVADQTYGQTINPYGDRRR